MFIHKDIYYVVASCLSMLLCSSAIPRIIYISKKKKLFDLPDNDRKVHSEIVPNLGGVGIFLGFSVISSLFVNTGEFQRWNYIVAAALILFVTGIKDDLINVNPAKKLIAQVAASFIVVYFADIRLDNMYGLLGVYELPYWVSIIFTMVGCTFISNAFNLIDGIDGLAGTIGVICTLFMGLGFATADNYSAACISFSLMGAIIGFLRYNIAPARIFMGDSGSLVIGFIISVLAIILIDSFRHWHGGFIIHNPKAVLLITLSLLFIPVFDTFRVFTTRLAKGHSPFRADRTHLHHFLLDLNFTHSQTVLVLAIVNLFIVGVALLLQDLPINIGLMSILSISFGLFTILYIIRRSKLLLIV